MRINVHHHHHLSDESRGLLEATNAKLTFLLKGFDMITKEVQDLMNQSVAANTVLASMDARFKAMVLQIADLQTTVSNLRAGSVMTDAEKQQITTLTGELAANVSNAQADILANTPDQGANGTADPNAPQGSQTGSGDQTGSDQSTGTTQTGSGSDSTGTTQTGSGSDSTGTTQTDPNAPPASGSTPVTGS